MLTSIEGTYRRGGIDLVETPSQIPEDTQVIITFLKTGDQPLAIKGISQTQAADLRARLATFAADWESPEMSIYDHYDAIKANL